MKSVCDDCDLGLKRSSCSKEEYIECECRRWLKKANQNNADGLIWFVEEVLELKLLDYQKELLRAIIISLAYD